MSQELIGIVGAATVAVALAAPVHAQVDCADWNTPAFFINAEAADTTRCLQAGADLNAQDENGVTPLLLAAILGRAETLTLLLEAVANPNARIVTGNTLLHMAAYSGQAESVTLLLEAGADSNARANDGDTPLHEAARIGQLESAATMLRREGADPNARAEVVTALLLV